jgi:hypothetical protein
MFSLSSLDIFTDPLQISRPLPASYNPTFNQPTYLKGPISSTLELARDSDYSSFSTIYHFTCTARFRVLPQIPTVKVSAEETRVPYCCSYRLVKLISSG